MKPPPDQKAVETLAAATAGRKARGKWRIVFVIVLALLVLAGGGLVALETVRQSSESAARREVTAQTQLIRARYADVMDWPEWYRNQLPPDCDGEALGEWINEVQASGRAEGRIADWADYCTSEGVYEGDARLPSDADLQQFLVDTDSLARQAEDLLRFEHLAAFPAFDAGTAYFSVLPRLFAFKLLNYRTQVLQRLGDWHRLWVELETALRLALKWDHPLSLVDLMVQLGVQRLMLERFLALVSQTAPPSDMLHLLQSQPKLRPEIGRELIQYEVAFYAQLLNGFDPDDEETWTDLTSGKDRPMFSYLSPTLSWRERKEAFQGNQLVLEAWADYLLQLRTIAETPGADLKDLPAANPMLEPFRRVTPCLRQVALLRESVALASRLLLAEAASSQNAAVARAATEFPDHEVVQTDSALLVRLRYTEQLAAQLPDNLANADEFYEVYEPIKLPLPR
jgi:hypothetical protein